MSDGKWAMTKFVVISDCNETNITKISAQNAT